ncbi:hypothetical protein E1283_00055 [Streptomyces hainanensis]|uniref:Abortive infection protein n=1 Tax=Streptomyces hainanensis TaxID=402648 RepID=A0A4R4TWT2_9ACTN|nr:hypothetical protein E1283_00055 [Streptomyces hainanensis]
MPRHYGVVYDVGLRFSPESLSVDPFDAALAEYDINTIANELHANAVRIEGEVIDRLSVTARIAHAAGLTVYFNPWKMNAGIDETRRYVGRAARVAERLRREGVDIVFVVGCELTIFTDGIYPGSSYMERGMWLAEQLRLGNTSLLAEKAELLNETLHSYVETVRARFGGLVTYASGLWEDVDWGAFDVVGLDAYRDRQTEEEYVEIFERHRVHGKPVATTEFGACKYVGAGALGAGGFAVLQGANADGTGIWEGGVAPTRSETEQADYIETQAGLMTDAGVDALLVFEFSKPALPTGEGAKDLDMASFAIVSTFPAEDPRSQQMPPWKRTEGFRRVSEIFARFASRGL